jgi:hypothetical protein
MTALNIIAHRWRGDYADAPHLYRIPPKVRIIPGMIGRDNIYS